MQFQPSVIGSLVLLLRIFMGLLPIILFSNMTLAQGLESQKTEANLLFQLDRFKDASSLPQGVAQSQNSQAELTIKSLLQALDIYRVAKNREVEEAILEVLGQTYQEKGEYAKAIDYFEQALLVTQDLRDRFKEMRVLGFISTTYILLGNSEQKQNYSHAITNYTKAVEYMENILAIVQERQDQRSELDVLTQLALNHIRIGDHIANNSYNYKSNPLARSNYTKAIGLLNQALIIAQKLHDRKNELKILGSLGNIYGDSFIGKNHAKAIEYYEQTLAITQELGDRQSEIRTLWFLAESYGTLGDYPKVINYYQKYLALAHDLKDQRKELEALRSLGGVYDRLKNHQKAIDYYQKLIMLSRQYKNRRYELSALHNLGYFYYSSNNYTKAEDYYRQTLKIERELNEDKSTSTATLGYLLIADSRFAEAETILLEGIEYIEADINDNETDASSLTAVSVNENIYSNLQQSLVAQGKTSAALEISERGRAFALKKLLTKRLAAESAIRRTIAPPQLQQLQHIAKQQNATLVEYSIIKNEANNGAVIGFHEPELYIWVIKPTGEVVFRTVDLKLLWEQQNISLDQLVRNSRKSLGIQGRGSSIVVELLPQADQTKELKKLHQILIKPIADVLPTDPNAHVIFMPQKALFLVPFPALQDANGKYLIEHHTILTAPAIQVLELTQQQWTKVQQTNLQSHVIVGNPTMPKVIAKIGEPPEQLIPLPVAEQEAISIAQLLNTTALIGNQANKVAILPQLSQARIIHLATHGLLDDFQKSGVPGAIALAPSANDDGLLTASEILDLKLNAELVVLSACDTGRGSITGDGVLGLSRSLIAAGVPSVIVSLWSVPDAPTGELMVDFYRNWREKKMDKAQALRQAMLTTMKTHPNPRDWAAFTLIGEAE
jgi:CHAT domain-containing protein